MDFEEIPSQNQQTNVLKNRITLATLIVVFMAPVLLAYMAYFGNWFPGGSKNKGDLVEKPWHIDDLSINYYSFGDWNESQHKGKWNWLLVVDKTSCDEICAMNWFLLQQTHLGLAKNQEKAGYFLVLNQNTASLDGDWSQIDLSKADIQNSQIQLKDKNELRGFNDQSMPTNKIYLMDPVGNIFISYELIQSKENAPLISKDLRTDLARLMRYLDVRSSND